MNIFLKKIIYLLIIVAFMMPAGVLGQNFVEFGGGAAAAAVKVPTKGNSVQNLRVLSGDVGYKVKENDKQASDLADLIIPVLNGLFGLLGVIFLGLVIWAGVSWSLALGNQQKIDSAKGVLNTSIIGMVLVFSAWMITSFILSLAK